MESSQRIRAWMLALVTLGVMSHGWLGLGCSADAPPSRSTPDAGPNGPGGGSVLPDGGTDEPPGAGPYGYDSRPSNPTCVAPERPVVSAGVSIQRAFSALSFAGPMFLVQAPNDSTRTFVIEREGVIRVFPHQANVTQAQVSTFLDISGPVLANGEGGLLGMAFHPQWPSRPELYVSYTTAGTGGSPLLSVISRFRSTDNGQTVDAGSEERLLTLDQPFNNHNGGGIAFGPDGFLYVGFGDGGSGNDPNNAGQSLNTLHGKFVRIDVNVPAAQKYGIPATNPFASSGRVCNRDSSAREPIAAGERCAEIYAWGFRNPWRWSFDTGTGELWVGDVGQSAREEIDLVVLGGNYGWKIEEGKICRPPTTTCDRAGLIGPVFDYDRTQGQSITGGYVYRGNSIPGLVGKFIYGDFESSRIWALGQNVSTGAYESQLLAETNIPISSFGQTLDGEVYVTGFDNNIYKLEPQGGAPAQDTFPRKLSETGCFEPSNPKQARPGVIPYDINSALWSDGADKNRWLALPDGTTIEVKDDGDWEFPTGSVLAKTFFVGGKRVETRLFMRHPDGTWGGYSYEWDDAETDATLLPAAKTKQVGSQTWYFPSRAQCLACHTAVAGRTLGPETAQMNRSIRYPTQRIRNQLSTLEGLGFFSASLRGTPEALPRMEDPSGSGALDLRARAYLHANCSGCHRSGAGQGPQDFRYALTLAEMNACDVNPSNGALGVTDAKIVAPGAPERSIVSVRMHAQDAYRMPPLGTSVVDEAGSKLVDAWIQSLSGCP